MSAPHQNRLPFLGVADFALGMDHVAESLLGGRVFAILHRQDRIRQILPRLTFPDDDPYTYVVIHGGQETTRFENMEVGTHEIPEDVVATLLLNEYGNRLNGMSIRMCTCYGNILRPGDAKTIVQRLAGLLSQARFEAYHGLVLVQVNPPLIRRSFSLRWDAAGPVPGPVVVGPPGPWEPVNP